MVILHCYPDIVDFRVAGWKGSELPASLRSYRSAMEMVKNCWKFLFLASIRYLSHYSQACRLAPHQLRHNLALLSSPLFSSNIQSRIWDPILFRPIRRQTAEDHRPGHPLPRVARSTLAGHPVIASCIRLS